LRFANQVADAAGAVNLAEHFLNSVDIPLGEVRDSSQAGDYTQWVVVKDLTQKVFYFRSYKDLCLKMVDMKKLNFNNAGPTLSIDIKKGAIDVTDELKTKERV
jgi:choloylglycine hydrolase